MADNEMNFEELFEAGASEPAAEAEPTAETPQTETPSKTERKSEKKAAKKAKKQKSAEEAAYEARSYSPIRKSREMKIGCLGGLMYFVFVLSVSIILACLAWMAASDVLALNKVSMTAVVELPDDIFTEEVTEEVDEEGNVITSVVTYADIDEVARILKEEGLIQYEFLFRFYCMISNASGKIAAGSYELSTDYDYRALVKKMNQYSGAAVTVEVMLPEGYTMEQIFEKLEENKVASKASLMDAAKNFSYNYSFLNPEDLGDSKRLEGYLFPDTYEFFAYMEPSSAIAKFLDNYNRRVTDEMEARAKEMGYTMEEVIIIASLIEKEAGSDLERKDIASVIYNRLNADMPLQIDATVLYATGKSEVEPGDTEYDSPYNTYVYKGLPEGPICNPGLASIKAALYPNSTKYYYYALDTATGNHRFFTNYNDHAAFVATQDYG